MKKTLIDVLIFILLYAISILVCRHLPDWMEHIANGKPLKYLWPFGFISCQIINAVHPKNYFNR
jgi:hypothetical protein